MIKTVAFLLVGLLLGAGAVSLWHRAPSDSSLAGADDGTGATLSQRVATLTASLGQERQRREELQAQLSALESRVDHLSATGGKSGAARTVTKGSEPAAGAESAGTAQPAAARFAAFRRNSAERQAQRIQALVAGGFTKQRAEWILQQADELRMKSLQARYEAAQQGKPFNPQTDSGVKTLHDVLGDQEYAQYLTALGRPTTISVQNVLPTSPAQEAGLKAGDQIVGYDGQRVFDVGELNRLTLQGKPGQQVEVDVVRDGAQMQLYVPSGPLGIMGGGRFRGRP